MMENMKITHADWKAIEDKYGNRPLTKAEVSDLLRISLEALQHFHQRWSYSLSLYTTRRIFQP